MCDSVLQETSLHFNKFVILMIGDLLENLVERFFSTNRSRILKILIATLTLFMIFREYQISVESRKQNCLINNGTRNNFVKNVNKENFQKLIAL